MTRFSTFPGKETMIVPELCSSSLACGVSYRGGWAMTKLVALVISSAIIVQVLVVLEVPMWVGTPWTTKRVHRLLALMLRVAMVILSSATAISIDRVAPWSAEMVGVV